MNVLQLTQQQQQQTVLPGGMCGYNGQGLVARGGGQPTVTLTMSWPGREALFGQRLD